LIDKPFIIVGKSIKKQASGKKHRRTAKSFFDRINRIFRMGVNVFCLVFHNPDHPVNPVKIIKKQHILKLAVLLAKNRERGVEKFLQYAIVRAPH